MELRRTRRLVVGVVGFVFTGACGGTSNPAAPSPAPSAGAFGVFLQSILSVSSDFGRCLQGSAESSCFAGTIPFPTSAAIAAPGNLVATSNQSSVTLTWTAPAGETATAYMIEAGSGFGLADLASFSTGNSATSFSVTGVSPGTYYVRVRAIGVSGLGPASNEVVLIVGAGPCAAIPGAPSGLVAVTNTGGTVVLQWNSATGSPTAYVIEVGSGPGLSNLKNSEVGLTTTLTATSVAAATYYIRMRAKNACGVGPASTELVLVVSPAPAPGPGPGPGPGTSFGPGRRLVGTDIAPGRYFSDPAYGCYWERQRGLSGTLADVIANKFIGFDARQWIVDILSSDRAFQGDADCGTWFNTPRHGTQSSISPGMWLVGPQVLAGTYRAEARYGCYWERLRNFTGTLDAIITNDFVSNPGTQYVSIGPLDVGFDADDDCGSWTRLYAIVETESSPDVSAPLPEIERRRNENRRQEGHSTR